MDSKIIFFGVVSRAGRRLKDQQRFRPMEYLNPQSSAVGEARTESLGKLKEE